MEKAEKVLIPKDKHAHVASGYSPLCMIDTAGKLLERIIFRRSFLVDTDHKTDVLLVSNRKTNRK